MSPQNPELKDAPVPAEDDLASIYRDPAADGDMTRLQRAEGLGLRRVLIGLTIFFGILAAASWAGFFLFSPSGGGFEGEKVALEIEGPAEARSGERVAYAVRYKNGENIPLAAAMLELRMPKQFIVESVEPVQDGNVWRLGSIGPGKEEIVTVTGTFIAPIGKTYDMQAILAYRPADFNSEFQKVATRGISVNDSTFDLSVAAPAKVLPGDEVKLSFAVTARSETDFGDLRFRPAFPDGFVPASAAPEAFGDGFFEWKLAGLKKDETRTVDVIGSFSSDAEGSREVKGTIGFMSPDGTYELQKEATASMDVLKGDLVTALILNGRGDDQAIRFGDKLRYTITYKNTGTAILENVEFALVLTGSPSDAVLRWDELVDKAKGVRNKNRIVWTKLQVPSLARIDANEEGAIDLEIPFMPAPDATGPETDYGVTAELEAKIGAIDGTESGRVAISRPVVAKAVSNAVFTARASYFDADEVPVGSGPLPPEVDRPTVYRITWNVANSLHELGDLRLSAKLPSNVVWTGKSQVDAGDLTFDAAGSKMVWTLNWMPTDIKSLTVSFDVALTPTADQRGKLPVLIDSAIFEARDRVNGYSILLSAPPLTTALEGDEAAAGKGRVK